MKKLFMLSLAGVFSLLMAADVKIKDAFIKAPPPGARAVGAFMVIENLSNKPIELISASSNVSKVAELHTHTKVDGMMKMHPVKDILIAAHSKTALKMGGYHIMLMELNKQLKVGDKVNLELKFNDNSIVKLDNVKVIKPAFHKHHHHHHHHHEKNSK